MLKLAIPYTMKRKNNSGTAFFTDFLDNVLNCQRLDDNDSHSVNDSVINFHKDEKAFTLTSNQSDSELQPSEMVVRNEIRAIFKEEQFGDFVPALIEGEKEFTKQWQERNWHGFSLYKEKFS